jgi:hypothetical protein
MKKFILSVLVTGLMVSTMAAADVRYSASQERMLISLCKAVKSDSMVKLSYTLKRANISYLDMQDGLVCNGKDPITFAMLNGAEHTAHMIARRTNNDPSTFVAKN